MFRCSKTSPNSYRFAAINFETEKMENYHDGSKRKLKTFKKSNCSMFFFCFSKFPWFPMFLTLFNMRKTPTRFSFVTEVRRTIVFFFDSIFGKTERKFERLDKITIVNSQGKVRSNRRTFSELDFDCEIRSLGSFVAPKKVCFFWIVELFFQFVYKTVSWLFTNTECKAEVWKTMKSHKKFTIIRVRFVLSPVIGEFSS